MLVFEAPKTGLLKVLLRTQNHMLSTQLLRLQASTHIERVHGCKAWFLAKRSLLFWTCLRSMSAQHHETYKATSSWHSVWTMIAHMAMEFRLRFLAVVWHGSLHWGSVREYLEGAVRFENNVRCTMDMPTIMPPKPTRNGPGTKEPLPTMQKEGTRNTQERFIFFPHRKKRRSWVSGRGN